MYKSAGLSTNDFVIGTNAFIKIYNIRCYEWHNIPIDPIDGVLKPEMDEWLDRNCSGLFMKGLTKVIFEKEEDAALFAFTWT